MLMTNFEYLQYIRRYIHVHLYRHPYTGTLVRGYLIYKPTLGTEFGAVVVTWKQTATQGAEVKNILWTKEHLRKQSFLTRLKYLVNTARQLPLFYLYRTEDSFLPIADAFGDLWENLERMDDGVGNRGTTRPGEAENRY